MLTTPPAPASEPAAPLDPTVTGRRPDLQWVGDGAWVATDPACAANDPNRTIAYLECKDSGVSVLWVSGATGMCTFPSLREALDAIEERLAPAA